MSLNPLLSLSLWLVFFTHLVLAGQTFNWTFINIPSDGFLSECTSTQLSVSTSPDNPPVPPYYLFAYEEFGPTTVKNLGSDVDNLFYTVDHSAGVDLLIIVIDSKGNSGGLTAQPFFVISNTDTSCHSFVQPSITINSNITKAVQTCAPVQFAVQGGQKPYTVSVVISGAPSVLNFTMNSEDDTLTWYNRAAPPQSFLFAASDAKGQYALSTGFGISSGTSDVTCPSLPAAVQSSSTGGGESVFSQPGVSQSDSSTSDVSPTAGGSTTVPTTATSTPMPPASPSPTSLPNDAPMINMKKKNHTGAIVGGTVAGVLVLVLILLGYFFYLRRQRQRVTRMNGAQVDLAETSTRPPISTRSRSGITPFVVSAATANPVADTTSETSSRPSKAALLVNTRPVLSSDPSGPSGSSNPSVPSASVAGSETIDSPDDSQTSSQPIIRRHLDIAEVSPDVLELPPAYSNRPPLTRPSIDLEGTSRPRNAVTNK